MTKKKKLSVKEVFDAVQKCNGSVKEASQLLKINKSRIYNIKSQNKQQWQAMEAALKEGDSKVFGEKTIARHAEHKWPKKEKGVMSEMAEKHANVTRSIEDSKKVEPPKLKQAAPEAKKPPVGPGSKHPDQKELAKVKAENEKLKTYNLELNQALDRANEAKADAVKKHNTMTDEFNDYKEAVKSKVFGLESEKSKLVSYSNDLEAENQEQQKRIEAMKDEVKRIQQEVHTARNTDVIDLDQHVIKLGKMYVSEGYTLMDNPNSAAFRATSRNPKVVAEKTGGIHYKAVLMEVAADAND